MSQIKTAFIQDSAVTTAKINNLAVTTAKLDDLGVTTAKLAASSVTDAKVSTGIDAAKIADGSVSNAEFQYVNGVTSAIQTQLDAKAPAANPVFTGAIDGSASTNVDFATTNTASTVDLGTGTGANTINIGGANSTVNIIGSVNNQNVTNMNVTDKLITINDGGAAASGGSAGIEVEENAVATAYVQTSSDRNSWKFKAPNTNGIASLTPGASDSNVVLDTATQTLTNKTIGVSQLSGAVSIANGGTNNASLAVTAGGALYTDGTKVVNVGAGTSGQFLKSNGASAPSWASPTAIVPTIQTFTSGSGTYNLPANCQWIRVKMVGGGGGGQGSGSGGGAGTAGNNTTFSTFTASGGSTGGSGGAGGTASGGDINLTGGCGQGPGNTTNSYGGTGGLSYFGGNGVGGSNAPTGGGNASTNSGSGGGGGGGGAAAQAGIGGGAGGYVEKIIGSPSSTYSYAVGASASGGAAGTSGAGGGNGAAGIIIVEEFY